MKKKPKTEQVSIALRIGGLAMLYVQSMVEATHCTPRVAAQRLIEGDIEALTCVRACAAPAAVQRKRAARKAKLAEKEVAQ